MKNVVVTILTVLVSAIAMATVAFGAQLSDTATAMSAMSDALSRAALQAAVTGAVAGIGTLPSTSTGGSDGMAFAALAVGAIAGGVVLIRKAITER
ncbi:MAG: hypothetical protein ACRDQ2_02520 [Gaiellales bacterium]